jgi:hypothetical protein
MPPPAARARAVLTINPRAGAPRQNATERYLAERQRVSEMYFGLTLAPSDYTARLAKARDAFWARDQRDPYLGAPPPPLNPEEDPEKWLGVPGSRVATFQEMGAWLEEALAAPGRTGAAAGAEMADGGEATPRPGPRALPLSAAVHPKPAPGGASRGVRASGPQPAPQNPRAGLRNEPRRPEQANNPVDRELEWINTSRPCPVLTGHVSSLLPY